MNSLYKRMAFYNSGVKTNIYDPVMTLSNNRVEWNLPADSMYLSSLRIHNIGAFATGGVAAWNKKGGIFSYIRNITLYDGGVILDQLRFVGEYMSFKNYNRANRNNVGMEIVKKGHQQGFILNNEDDGTLDEAYTAPAINTAEGTTSRYCIDLREVLPMLRNSQFLPGQLYRNLRVVVEFDVDSLKTLHDNTQIATLSSLTDSLLVVDELVNAQVVQQAMTSYAGVSFSAIEYDGYSINPTAVPALVAGGQNTATTSTTLTGFHGKFVNRLLMYVAPTTALAAVGVAGGTGVLTSYGKFRAARLNAESIQVRLNGSNMFAPPLADSAQKLALLHDTWGICDHPPMSHEMGVFSLRAKGQGLASDNYVADMVNSNSYLGMFIRDRVETLQLDITQTQFIPVGSANPQVIDNAIGNNQDILLGGQTQQVNIFGEVRKSILVQGDNYRVIYN
tara:strand:- start:2773 stop:4119 length:1347 start_codon:yes stop_codon:yes gene_type:complete